MKMKMKKEQEFVDNMTSLSRVKGFKIEMTYGLTLSFPMQSQALVHKTKKAKTLGTEFGLYILLTVNLVLTIFNLQLI